MPNKIKLRRSYTAGAVPLTSDLETNECCINYADNKLYVKTPSGTIQAITLGGGGGGSAGSLSGSVTIPGLGDPAYENVSLLLHCEGATIIDSSANPKTFTVSGSAATSAARAKFGSGSLLIGTSSTFTSNSSSDFAFGTGDFTVEFWMNAAALPTAESRLVNFGGTANQFFNLAYGQGSNTFSLVNEGVAHVVTTQQSVALNEWHHVAYTRSAGTLYLLFNGAVLGSTSGGGVNTPTTFIQFNAGDGSIYYDDIRVTKGLARYAAAYVRPSSPFADASSITVPVVYDAKPDAPTSLTATAGNAQLSLAWTAPTNQGSPAITGYSVEYTPSGGSAQTVATGSRGTSYTLAGLANGTAYTVRVAAVNPTGTGAYSAGVSVTLSAASVPSAPTSVRNGNAYWACNAGDNAVMWNVPSSNGGSAITGYVWRIGSGSLTSVSPSTGTSGAFSNPAWTGGRVEGLPTGGSFQVAAVNAIGTGAFASVTLQGDCN
jgi:hypothetical protein